MRPVVRLLQPLEVPSRHLTKTLYICSNCRQEFLPRSLVNPQARRNASGNTPFTEKVRRRIWGTDNPPGLKDPYGGEGVIEKAWKKRDKEQSSSASATAVEQKVEAEEEDFDLNPQQYVPATTIDGLERMGHLGRWSDFPPTEDDEYVGFLSKYRITSKDQVHIAAHQTAVELCLLHELKKSLTDACDVLEHDYSIYKMITEIKIQPVEENGTLDGRLSFPNDEAKNALYFVFEQLGRNIESEAEAEAETSVDDVEAAMETEEAVELEDEGVADEVDNIPGGPFFGDKVSPQDSGYLSISLADPSVKFAFLKRMAQLTGFYFPDVNTTKIQNVQQVVDYLEHAISPASKKLAPQLAEKEELQNLPNVRIYSKKRTKAHNDRDLGREKLIREALHERGLL